MQKQPEGAARVVAVPAPARPRIRLRHDRIRLSVLFGAAVFAGYLLAGCADEPPAPGPPAPSAAPLAVPAAGAYLGAYIDFGEAEDTVTLEAIEAYETLVGKHQAIIASSSFWGEESFPQKNLELIARHGAVPLVYWSPWDRPYSQSQPPDRFRLDAILAGTWDGYLDRWADGARAYGRPILVAWGLEMNGHWFPWSGCHYGGGTPAPAGGFAGPALYKAAFRHVVDRVRARGAGNIQWVFHVNHLSFPAEPWNAFAQYYPGAQYVDWLGVSIYGKQFAASDWLTFRQASEAAFRELAALDPSKPIMVAEFGVGEYPQAGSKADWLQEALAVMRDEQPRVKAAVYWHERWQNADESYSNLRVNSSPAALAAFREQVSDPHWLPRPQLAPASR
ncbi:MAG: glycosyl hydrolase [Thermodesulfobacteriota bacterium]